MALKIQEMDNYKTRRNFSLRYNDGTNLRSVDSNKNLFDKYTKVVIIGDNVRAIASTSLKEGLNHKVFTETNSNIKRIEEAKLRADQLLEFYRTPARKITLSMDKTGYELMKPGDLITLNFPSHDIPADDYIVFEIENVMSSVAKITVGTFTKTIAERLAEMQITSNREQGNIMTMNLTQEVSSNYLEDMMNIDELSLKYSYSTQSGGTTFGFA